MKLKTKLILIMLIVLAGAMGVCAAFSIGRLEDYSLSVQVESEREKLRIAGRAFRQVGTDVYKRQESEFPRRRCLTQSHRCSSGRTGCQRKYVRPPVSYTHLDVYKRQIPGWMETIRFPFI